jgi:hypothetical protein
MPHQTDVSLGYEHLKVLLTEVQRLSYGKAAFFAQPHWQLLRIRQLFFLSKVHLADSIWNAAA